MAVCSALYHGELMHLLHIPLLLVGPNADLLRANSPFHHMPSAVKCDRGPLKAIFRLQNDSAVSDRIYLVTDRPKDLAIFQLNQNPCSLAVGGP